ncbi:hypothetical protein [Spiroplasma endosymbiont of Sarcophaga variegata]|uniref:hypothetical protein n=1 Tax=Spiroplasma endosymbiont of Sarcophaga variegata TaxID=3066304 RepID=UPI003AF953C9
MVYYSYSISDFFSKTLILFMRPKKSKEIYHKINYEKLEYFKKEISIGPTLKIFPNILEVNEEEQNKILYDNWDTNIFELNKNENLEVITINRQSCLSL